MGCRSCGQARPDRQSAPFQRNPNPSPVGVPAKAQKRVEFYFETEDGEQSFDRLSDAKRASNGNQVRTRRV